MKNVKKIHVPFNMGKRGGGHYERFVYDAFLWQLGNAMADLSERVLGISWVAQKEGDVACEK